MSAVVAALGGAPAAHAQAGDPEIRVLSSRADLVSGGDALVEVVLPAGTDPASVRLDTDGRDVTSHFALRPGGRFVGLVEGLHDGDNVLTARLPDGRGARITLANHPRGGPLFAGPQIQPWTCLEGALDAQCNRAPTYTFLYKSTDTGQFEPYDPENPPGDVAQTTTDHGVTVPYIVRQESGAIDRDEYRIAVLYDPSQPWTAWAPQRQFNRKLVITHGASCDTSYEQGDAPDVLDDTALGRGFAVLSHALDNAGHNCNIVVQAESLVMTKEHLVERYGELRYTIGSGCSGGALAQQAVANAYPGVYQGITPACSFPDSWSAGMLYDDYSLLRRYFENPTRWEPGVVWAEDDIGAVWGHPNHVNAITYNTVIQPTRDPSRTCPGLPAEKVYDAQTNPRGVRCSLQDYMVSIFGRREKDGFAGKPWDNEGILYGLHALIAGKITPAQFVDVNTKVGGRDIDYEPTEARAQGDLFALERAYRSGAVNQATHLDKVAIIDLRGPDPGAFHDVYRSYAVRSRLDREHGHHDNHVMWRGTVPLMGDPDYASEAIVAMDEWLAKVEADPRDLPLARKIVLNKPESARERCSDGVPGGSELPPETCDALVESYSTARIEAGGPFADDTLKCELQPLRRSLLFPLRFSDAQWGRLQEAFPDGVCDYGKPGVGRVPTVAWLTYQDGPGGKPLGPVPASVPLGRGAPSAPPSLGLPSARRCLSGRRLTFRLRAPLGERLRSARVYVNGRRVRTRRGRTLSQPVRLRGLPRGIVRVKIAADTAAGRKVSALRRYRTCNSR